MGLGADTTAGLTAAIEPVLEQGATFGSFDYQQDDMAGGVATDAADYAIFLRNILAGRLMISALLGSNAVCTNPATCTSAKYSPIDANSNGTVISNESWHYSLIGLLQLSAVWPHDPQGLSHRTGAAVGTGRALKR
jgi:hypothetical protein